METEYFYLSKDCGIKQFLALVGSYYGVTLSKDLGVTQCEVQERLPRAWQELSQIIRNQSQAGQQFPQQNITFQVRQDRASQCSDRQTQC